MVITKKVYRFFEKRFYHTRAFGLSPGGSCLMGAKVTFAIILKILFQSFRMTRLS